VAVTMTAFDARRVVFPSELPQDPKHLAELAERTREQEVEGLRRELAQVLAQREAVASQRPTAAMVVVNTRTGKPVPDLEVRRISAGLDAERIEEELEGLDAAIAAITAQLEHRNAQELSAVPKVKGNVKPPKLKK
jgi:hypothetical protein